MNVLFWQEDHPHIHGGAEAWLFDTMAALRLRGHNTEWLHTNEIENKIKEMKPDAIVVGTVFNFIGFEYVHHVIESGIPAVWFIHDYWPFCGPRMLMRDNNASDLGCEASEGGVCTGCSPRDVKGLVNQLPSTTGCQGAADIMRKNGINIKFVMEEGIDTDLFPSSPVRTNERVVYCHAAGDEVWKGGHIIREALKNTDIELRFITGRSRKEVGEILSTARVYAFPSVYQEIWGLSLTEAMCCGCAVVATDVAGARAQVENGVTGLIVPKRDPDALREAIVYLLDRPDQCELYSFNARTHVLADHGLEAIGERWEKLLYTDQLVRM